MAVKLPFKKKQIETDLPDQQEAQGIHEPDFIPYSCHYDHETLLTRNGELMQTIKIVGFSFESVGQEMMDLRETIRAALSSGVDAPHFSVSIHTIRRRKNLSPGGIYKEAFPRYVHEVWNHRNDWTHKYINELFITVVRDGESANISTPPTFLRGLIISRDIAAREDHLRDMHQELNIATARMMEKLEIYGAHKLGVFKKDGIYYSEYLRFLGKILKLREEEVPLNYIDLSQQLASHKVNFGHDMLEVRSPDDSRRFGTLLTLKEYHEISLAAIDNFLQLPEEFIVTQTMNFIDSEKALKSFKYQQRMAELSGDKKLAKLSGLDDIVESVQGKPTDFGEHQITVFLIADDLKHLNRYLESTLEVLSSLGIVAVREDVRLEDAYWSQLPGNFNFLKRLSPIATSRIAGFANLSNYPAGKLNDNHWGPAITVFDTAAHTPYFFNFHNGSIGHTSIIGPFGSGKTVLMNFLLSESRKLNTKLFLFDYERNSEVFIRALGGQYDRMSVTSPSIALNPLQLEPTPGNLNFLNLWVESLLTSIPMDQLPSSQTAHIPAALQQIFTLPREQRHLATLAQLLGALDGALAERLAPWHSGGSHAGIFGYGEDQLDLESPIHGFEMAEIVNDWHSVPPVMLYLMHRTMQMLDGTPTIIVLDEAWNLVDNYYFAPRIQPWLEAVSHRNGLVIFATESIEGASQSAVSGEVFSKIATQIYLPNPDPGSAYQDVFGLTDEEFELLSLMSQEQRHFMLKKGDEAIIAQLNLSGLEKVLHVLSSQEAGLEEMEAAIAAHGPRPENWLPAYHTNMSARHEQQEA